MIHVKAMLIGSIPIIALVGFLWLLVSVPRPVGYAMLGVLLLPVIYFNGRAWMSRP